MKYLFGRLSDGLVLVPMLVVAVSCGSDSGSSGPVDQAANPCATPGSTYLQTLTEVSGDCGAVPSQIVNVNPDGTITMETKLSCAKVTQTGCTARDTDCKWSSNGYDFTMTFSTTFAEDGSSAMGIATMSGRGNGQSCTSTYQMNMVRQ